jgi:hypothetical protein
VSSPARYIGPTQTARLVRDALKASFPGIRFSVRTERFAGGASVTVSWIDGPRLDEVRSITRRFHGYRFDGSIDLAEPIDTLVAREGGETELVRYGIQGVSCQRGLSDAMIERCVAELAILTGGHAGQKLLAADLSDHRARLTATFTCERGSFEWTDSPSALAHRYAELRDALTRAQLVG